MIGQLIGGSLQLEASAFRLIETLPAGSRLAFFIVLLAGFSTALGQSVVLFINRVEPKRFTGSLLVSTLIYVFTYLFWTTSIFLIARYLFGDAATWGTAARAVGLGYAPQLFNVLAFMPFFGVPVLVMLSLWSLLAILGGVSVVLGLSLGQALVCSVLGWVALQLLERTVGRPVIAVKDALRRRVAGKEIVTDIQGLETLVSGSNSAKGRQAESSPERTRRD